MRSAPRAFTNIDLADAMKRMIRQLPQAQQEVVHLTFYEGLSQREIASQKSIALGTVKTRLQLAQKKLLNQLTAVEGKF
jgi:RNA polymerase sigma-70 factor, ECF subfamily